MLQYPEQKSGLTHELTKQLHEKLAQTVINFFKDNPIPEAWAVDFRFDDIQGSVSHGSWQPCSDSAVVIEGIAPDGGLSLLDESM